jgi:hypothetical protein
MPEIDENMNSDKDLLIKALVAGVAAYNAGETRTFPQELQDRPEEANQWLAGYDAGYRVRERYDRNS